MKDFIAAGTGNSRYLKTSLPDGTTWQEALAMLRNGTFPIDLNGINAEGVTQIGTPLNKANLLSDESAALFGLDSDAVIDDVWELLSTSNTLSTIMVTTEQDSRVTATKGGIVKYGTPINDVYIIRGLTPGSWTVTAGKGTDTASQIVVISDPQQYQVTLTYPRIYGVSWRFGNSSTMTRTDDAAGFADPQPYVLGASTVYSPFDNLMPWAGMERVTDEICGELVAIPKFWYKLEYIVEEVGGVETNVGINIKISPTEQQGFHVSPAHMPRTENDSESNIVLIGRYKCASDLKSKSGAPPASYTSATQADIQYLESGKTYNYDFATWFTILLLYLVEYADWDSQKKIGYGGYVTEVNSGYTDNMPYHTGTMRQSRESYGAGTQYRYLEGLWEQRYEMVTGIISGTAVNPSSGFSELCVNVGGRYNPLTGDLLHVFDTDVTGIYYGYVTSVKLFQISDGAIFPVFLPNQTNADGNEPVGTHDIAERVDGIYRFGFGGGKKGNSSAAVTSQEVGISGFRTKLHNQYNTSWDNTYYATRLIKLP